MERFSRISRRGLNRKKKKTDNFSYTFFFARAVLCQGQRFNFSIFQVLTRKSGGANRAFTNIVRLLAGPYYWWYTRIYVYIYIHNHINMFSLLFVIVLTSSHGQNRVPWSQSKTKQQQWLGVTVRCVYTNTSIWCVLYAYVLKIPTKVVLDRVETKLFTG